MLLGKKLQYSQDRKLLNWIAWKDGVRFQLTRRQIMNSEILQRKRPVILLGFPKTLARSYYLLVNFRSILIYSLGKH